ncbi:PSMC3 interacting protein [Perkinsus chesapeaki]|uniref:PSMC3 interacting protein n=1 Tax=Perkinsus chesapeaki TaxID=330153 RepID=A0A7J6LRR5_PERCH|nr:PSMC3 interacting protein [Perkinsus chesapeaki]
MKEQNRPYSAQNVFDNLHGIVPKAQVQNLMEKLSKQDENPPLVMKEYGAQKVFLCNQNLFGDCSTESVLKLGGEVADIEKTLPTLRTELSKISSEISHLRSQSELEGKVEANRKRVRELETRIEAIQKERLKAGDAGLEEKLEEARLKFGDLHETVAKRRKLPTKPSTPQQEPVVAVKNETRKSHIEELNVKRESAIMSSRSKVGMSEVPRRSFLGHDHLFKYRQRSGGSEMSGDLVSIEDVEELRKKATSLRYRVAKLKLEKERDERIIGNLLDFLMSFRDGKLLVEQLRFENRIAC